MSEDDLSAMLRAWSRGEVNTDRAAGELYRELQRRARAHLRRESGDDTLSPADLVQETFLRLSHQHVPWANHDQFYAAASRTMRRVLVDHARARRARKRAGVRIELENRLLSLLPAIVDVLVVDEALRELGRKDERQAQLIELRFFSGLTLEEAASALSISLATANRDWRSARDWLAQRLAESA